MVDASGKKIKCLCPLEHPSQPIIVAGRHSYYPQMSMLLVKQDGGRKSMLVHVSKTWTAGWGRCFCRHYLQRGCTDVQVLKPGQPPYNVDMKPTLEIHTKTWIISYECTVLHVCTRLTRIQRLIRGFLARRRATQ
jgi:hypothetical protein